MAMVIKTQASELRAGDKVYIPGCLRPVTVEAVDGQNVKCVNTRGRVYRVTAKELDRVVNGFSDVVRDTPATAEPQDVAFSPTRRFRYQKLLTTFHLAYWMPASKKDLVLLGEKAKELDGQGKFTRYLTNAYGDMAIYAYTPGQADG